MCAVSNRIELEDDTMAITDTEGNKLPQPKIKKTIKSANERARIAGADNHCACGFHKRGVGHNNGSQHRQWWNQLDKPSQEKHVALEPITC